MHVEVRHGARAFDDLGPELDDLFAATGAPITARRRWLSTCARELHPDPLLVTIRDGSELVAAASLARGRRRGVTTIAGVGDGVSDRAFLPARDARAADALAEGIVELAASWSRPWRLRLEQLPTGDAVARALVDRLPVAELVAGDQCPVLSLDGGRDIAEYEQSGLRKQVRSGQNRLKTDGRTCAVERRALLGEIEDALPAVRRVHRARDHELGRPSRLDDEAGRRLWDDLVLGHAADGAVEAVLLLIDGSLAAYGIAFVDAGAYRVWDARIDSAFGRYAPGHLLGRALLEAALARDDVTCFDWGRGLEPYKRLIATELEDREHLVAWSSRTARRALEVPRAARRWLAEVLDKNPRARRAWVWLKRHTIARG